MKKSSHGVYRFAAIVLTMSLSLSGCSVNKASAEEATSDVTEATIAPEDDSSSDENDKYGASAINETDTEEHMEADATERVSVSHDGIELSLALPSGWSYRICSAEECAELDGMMLFGISFWPDAEPVMELSYGYYAQYGLCGTGITIEETMLKSGIKAWKYTEVYDNDNCMWMNIIPELPGWTFQDGSCVMECFVPLDMWSNYEDAIMEIAETLEASSESF